MSIRKCADLGPEGVNTPGANGAPGNQYDYRFTVPAYQDPDTGQTVTQPNVHFFQQTDTKWVRLWANWNYLVPASGQPNVDRFKSLDGQIKAARDNGLNVILVTSTFPQWANGSSNQYQVPSNVGAGSAWSWWIYDLLNRYRPGGTGGYTGAGTTIQLLEICNEPNYEMQPAPGVDMITTVATMMETAQAVSQIWDHSVFLGAPATSDTTNTDKVHAYDFTLGLLYRLQTDDFRAHSRFVWTHHNYNDVEHRLDTTNPVTGSSKQVNQVRGLLQGTWTGYSEGNGPQVFVTEGGARLNALSGTLADRKASQQQLVDLQLDELAGNVNVGMTDNYLVFDAVTGSYGYSGLMDPYGGSGTPSKRPAYKNPGWSSQPSQGAPSQIPPTWEAHEGPYKYDPAVLSRASNHLEYFGVGSDNAIWHAWWDGSGWNGPQSLGGYCITGPAAISRSNAAMDVFVRSSDNQIWTTYWTPTTGWPGGWAPLGGTGSNAPGACSQNTGHMEVFVRGTDNQVYRRAWSSTSGWGAGWTTLGGAASSAPAAVSRKNGRMDVFVLSGTNLWTTWYTSSAGWAGGWAPLGAPPVTGGCASSPAAASWSATRADVFVKDANGKLWRRFCDEVTDGSGNVKWSAWEPVWGSSVASAPAVVSRHTAGAYDLVARRSDDVMLHNWQA